MPFYRVRAHETDTLNDTIFEGSTRSFDRAIDRAEQRAKEYYGGDKLTWSTPDGPGRYLVGRIREDGTREGVTCVITVENHEEIPESRRRV